MTMSYTVQFKLMPECDTNRILDNVRNMALAGLKNGTVVITLSREKRSLSQNARLWATLKDIEQQVVWHGNKLTSEEWKHVFTAALKRQKTVLGIDGGFVVLGQSTSKMSKSEFSDLMEVIHSFGAEHKVKWNDPALDAFAHYNVMV